MGDAAHLMSSMGGMSAHTAIIDAADLCRSFAEGKGWKGVSEFQKHMGE